MGFLDTLRSTAQSLSSFAASGRGASVLGVDIGSSAIKVVQLRSDQGAIILETYGELSLGPYAGIEIGRATTLDIDKLSEALRDILREANVTTKRCGVSIPLSSSLISLLELPAVDNATLKTMVPLEARKYIPLPIEEVQLDWFIVPEEDSKFLSEEVSKKKKEEQKEEKGVVQDTVQVLLVAIHNEILRKYNTVLKAAELTPSFYEIEIFSTVRASLGRGIAPTVVLDIGASRSKLYIVEAGIVRSTHVINKGSQDITVALSSTTGLSITKAEELKRSVGLTGMGDAESRLVEVGTSALKHIFVEAERAIVSYQRRYNTSINEVILTGGGATMKGAIEYAQKTFKRDVILSDPFKKTETPAFLEEILKQAGPEFTVALGLALRKLKE